MIYRSRSSYKKPPLLVTALYIYYNKGYSKYNVKQRMIITMRTVFSIGETAKIHHISKQSLIFYDKIDLLKPSFINEENGYRYYTIEEFAVLDIILFLKTLDVPLAEIKTYIQERNITKSINFFEKQLVVTEEKIRSLKAIKRKIENTLSVYEEYKECNGVLLPFIKERKEQHSIQYPVDAPHGVAEVDLSLKKLLYYVEQKEYLADYTLGTTVSITDMKNEQFARNKKTFIIINKNLRIAAYKAIAAGKYATIYHHGSYETIAQSYRMLLDFIKKENYKICSEAYEYLLFDIFVVKDKKDFITEISIQVQE